MLYNIFSVVLVWLWNAYLRENPNEASGGPTTHSIRPVSFTFEPVWDSCIKEINN